jgi:hypothetical protein
LRGAESDLIALTYRRVPLRSCLCPEEAQDSLEDEVALEIESGVNGGMDGEEALGCAGRREALHFPLASLHCLMRVLG